MKFIRSIFNITWFGFKEPLNSGDDVSEPEDSNEKLYEIDNVVVCQYDKVKSK